MRYVSPYPNCSPLFQLDAPGLDRIFTNPGIGNSFLFGAGKKVVSDMILRFVLGTGRLQVIMHRYDPCLEAAAWLAVDVWYPDAAPFLLGGGTPGRMRKTGHQAKMTAQPDSRLTADIDSRVDRRPAATLPAGPIYLNMPIDPRVKFFDAGTPDYFPPQAPDIPEGNLGAEL